MSISPERKARKREMRRKMRRLERMLTSEFKERSQMCINDPTMLAVLKRVAR